MTYIIIYLILNQLAHWFILHIAKAAGDDEVVEQLGTFGGWFFNSIAGFPLALSATVAGFVAFLVGKE